MGIRILDAATVGRIAAGEVVERPASVVKELMENALDAGATSITVELKGGGVDSLRVTDNGSGIEPAEVRLAFENHATSKLVSADQLDDIRTLGFRGEALPSIASVARVTCTTRRRGADSGVKLKVEGGRFESLTEVGCPEGTTIVAQDLFFNVPVRRAFLKRASIEAGAASGVVSALALANPGVAVRLIVNGKTVLHTFGDGNLRHAALAVYGKEVAAELKAIDQMDGAFRIEGLIGVGDAARPSRAEQHFFINGRVVRCALLSQALESAASGRVTIGMHPMCMLSLTLPPQSVDVNVHPNKLEVRFRDEPMVRQSVDAMFARALSNERMFDVDALTGQAQPVAKATVVSVSHPEEESQKKTEVSNEQTEVVNSQTEVAKYQTEVSNAMPDASDTIEPAVLRVTPQSPGAALREGGRAFAQVPTPTSAFNRPIQEAMPVQEAPPPEQLTAIERANAAPPSHRVIGVLLNTYLLVEANGSLIMIDQHAAHERILYEQYAKKLDESADNASQTLLAPILIPANAREIAQVEADQELLREAGFDVSAFDERTLAVRAVPFILGKADLTALFMEMLDKLDRLKYAAKERRRGELIQMSCKHAVKGGDRLSDSEIEELLSAMQGTQSPATCPHGRPVCRVFGKNELERMFKRQQ